MSTGGLMSTGGTQAAGGNASTGGSFATTGSAKTGGASNMGGNSNTGGAKTGGASSTGGAKTGGASSTGGSKATGGAACTPTATGGPNGMDEGRACVSCHASGESPAMKLAGTLYSTVTGGAYVTGATITITGANGVKTTLVSGSKGDFYTNTSISFPAEVTISKCPNTVVAPSNHVTHGDCNACHSSSNRIHLP